MPTRLRSLRVNALAAIGALSCLLALQTAHADEAAPAETVRALWQVQEIYFPYFGLTTNYSCDALRDKMRDFLKQLGAREDVAVSPAGCVELSAPEKHPSVRVVLAHPVEATDANKQAIAQDPRRAELLEQLQRKSKVPVAPANEPFDAVRRKVVLNTKESSYVTASGDCELLDQMRRTMFGKLGIKVIDNQVSCTPYQGSPSNQRMHVEVLAAVVPAKS